MATPLSFVSQMKSEFEVGQSLKCVCAGGMTNWPVEHVVYEGGMIDNTGCILKSGLLCASDRHRGRNGTFWAVKNGLLHVQDRQNPAGKLRILIKSIIAIGVASAESSSPM